MTRTKNSHRTRSSLRNGPKCSAKSTTAPTGRTARERRRGINRRRFERLLRPKRVLLHELLRLHQRQRQRRNRQRRSHHLLTRSGQNCSARSTKGLSGATTSRASPRGKTHEPQNLHPSKAYPKRQKRPSPVRRRKRPSRQSP